MSNVSGKTSNECLGQAMYCLGQAKAEAKANGNKEILQLVEHAADWIVEALCVKIDEGKRGGA